MISNRFYILAALSFVALVITFSAASDGNVVTAGMVAPPPTVNWMTWTAPTGYPNTRSGSPTFKYTEGASGSLTLPNNTVVSATLTGEVVDQSCFSVTASGCPTGYWRNTGYAGYPTGTFTSTNVPSLPPNVNLIVQTGYVNTLHTLTFSQPVSNVVMTIVSLGGDAGKSSYTFNQDFTILSQDSRCNPAITFSPNKCLTKNGRVLEGWEGAGTIQFEGTYTSLTWDVTAPEYYSGFNVGVSSAGPVATPSPSPSPSPTPATGVTNTNDSGTGSLRNEVANAASGATITIPGSVTGTINLQTPIAVDKDLTIVGPGARSLDIKAPSGQRAFTVADGRTGSISKVKISGTGTISGDGGVLSNAGTLSLTEVQVSGGNATGSGGGVASSGALTVTRSTVSGNTAGGSGGGIYCTGLLTLINSTVANNTAGQKGGGVAAASGLAHVVTNNTVSGNTAASAGGIYTGTLNALNRNAPNAVSVNWMTWTAPAGYPGSYPAVGFTYANGANATLTRPNGTTVSAALTGEVINQSCFSATVSGCPSGWWKQTNAYSYYNPSTFTSANVPNLPPTPNQIMQTGYVNTLHTLTFNEPVSNVVMVITSLGGSAGKSSYTFNQDFTILSQDPNCVPSRTTSMNNCLTKTGRKLEGWEGAGVIQFDGTYSSITWDVTAPEYYSGFNIGISSAGPGAPPPSGTNMTMSSNIVAQNASTGSNPDLEGDFTSTGNNLIGAVNGSTGFTNGINKDIVGANANLQDPGLEPLGNYGGGTDTMKLGAASQAREKGASNALAVDQRGAVRIWYATRPTPLPGGFDGTDIGAFELPIGTTAAGVGIGGTVRSTSGRALAGVTVSVYDTESGGVTVVKTNSFGRFQADDLTVGRLYIVTVGGGRIGTATQPVMLYEALAEVDFVVGR